MDLNIIFQGKSFKVSVDAGVYEGQGVERQSFEAGLPLPEGLTWIGDKPPSRLTHVACFDGERRVIEVAFKDRRSYVRSATYFDRPWHLESVERDGPNIVGHFVPKKPLKGIKTH